MAGKTGLHFKGYLSGRLKRGHGLMAPVGSANGELSPVERSPSSQPDAGIRPARHGRISDEARRRNRVEAIREACANLLGHDFRQIRYPGGRNRESLKLKLTDGPWIVGTERDSERRAAVEARVLRCLHDAGAKVPDLLATDGNTILLQEYLDGDRLAAALRCGDSAHRFRLLEGALASLVHAQAAGNASGLAGLLPRLGTDPGWIAELIRIPAAIGSYLDVPAPCLDNVGLEERLQPPALSFVKWDTRPGNAISRGAAGVFWFDWEHAGVRCGLDDLAWLLCDEYVVDDEAIEGRLIDIFLPRFAPSLARADAHDYLRVFGTFHTLVRLGLVLRYMDDGWWDEDWCIGMDKVGVTLGCALDLCSKGVRWSGFHPLTKPLGAWFLAVRSAVFSL